MLRKFALASLALVFAIAASGRQSLHTGPSLAEKVEDLLRIADQHQQLIGSLDRRLRDLEQKEENGRYQITAVTWNSDVTGGVPYTAVFMVDTKTGYVCQVVSDKVRKGELMGGTTLPYCTQSGPQSTGLERPDVPMPKCLHYDKNGFCTEFEHPNR